MMSQNKSSGFEFHKRRGLLGERLLEIGLVQYLLNHELHTKQFTLEAFNDSFED